MSVEAPVAGVAGVAQRWLFSSVRIVVWVFVYLTFLLSAWVGLARTVGGWSPVVITSGSMEPMIGTGDVLLVDTDTDEPIGQRDIVVFDRGGVTIAHRVFAVEGDTLVTKGDANATPDSERVETADIRGSGRLVVPAVGLPVVWAGRRDWLPLGAWAVLMLAGTIRIALTAERFLTSRRRSDDAHERHPIGRLGIQRVRNLMAVLIVVQFLIDDDRFDVVNGRLGSIALVGGAVAALLTTNLLASWADRVPARNRVGAFVELGLDTALVVVLATATGSSGFSWVLFSLPNIEAAVRFRLIGALVHWMLLTAITLAAKVWAGADDPSTLVLDDLETLLDQLSVLFLVVVPAAYLAEQLIGEVTTWQRATGQAIDRSQLLVQVADISRDIVRIDGGHLDAILAGVRSLGFWRADIVVEEAGAGGWRVVGGDQLPTPGGPASGVRPGDLARAAVFVDGRDADAVEVDALETAGLDALIAQVVSERDGRRIVLRAGVDTGSSLTVELVEAFRLLAGQATVAMRNEQLLDEITDIHDELEHQALHDALTGLPNRARLQQQLSLATDDGARPALFFLDLNGFKPVNDRLGHEIGDRVLQMVGARLQDAVPRHALVARLGGDEFTVLVPDGMSPDEAGRVAASITHAIEQPYDVGPSTVHISTAVGIAFGGRGIGETELVRRADVAMYEAKHRDAQAQGFEIYRADLDTDGERRAELTADLRAALADGAVHLAFQPVYDVASRPGIAGVEALVRWTHPRYGAVPPPDIIETARAAHLQDELSRHILLTACRQAAAWRLLEPRRRCFVAVNASPEELGSGALVASVGHALAATGLPSDWLFVEISERLVSPASDSVLTNVSRLRELGVGLLLDDFGQGNTSLSYLHELPLAGVKLDRRLVVNALRSDTDRIVLHSIVELSRRLGHLVIAEGVETAEHLGAIVDAGCTLAQGFHLARPQPADDVLALLRAQAGRALPAVSGTPAVAPGTSSSVLRPTHVTPVLAMPAPSGRPTATMPAPMLSAGGC